MIICTVGKLKSGKSKLAEIIGEVIDYPIIEVSSLVKEFAQSSVRKDLQAERDKHKDNPNWLYDKLKERLLAPVSGSPSLHKDNCIVSGIREYFLLDQMREDFSTQKIIVIAAEIRDEERQRRAAAIDKKTEQQFLEDDVRDAEFDINEIMEVADYRVNTELPLEETKKSLMMILQSLGRGIRK